MEYSIAFIGYGEAAYNISYGLQNTKPTSMIAYDIMWDDPDRGGLISERMQEVGVVCAANLEEAYKNAKFIVSLTSAATAVSISSKIIGNLAPGQAYIDMNSASPMAMEEINDIPRAKGVKFCDASLLGNVMASKHLTKMMLSGDGAEEFYNFFIDYSPNVTCLETCAGSASAIKMFKSVFSKGFPQLLLECLVPAAAYGVFDIVFDSFKNIFDNRSMEQYANDTIYRTLIHAKRRYEETSDVADTIESLGYGSEISRATSNRLLDLANHNYNDVIGETRPNLEEVIQLILESYKNK